MGPIAAFQPVEMLRWRRRPERSVLRSRAAALSSSGVRKKPPPALARLVAALHDAECSTAGVVRPRVRRAEMLLRIPLIPHPAIRKISFTGSTAVGKQLAGLTGTCRSAITTMEHRRTLADACIRGHQSRPRSETSDFGFKFRKRGGQVCTSPTRILVHEEGLSRRLQGRGTAPRVRWPPGRQRI